MIRRRIRVVLGCLALGFLLVLGRLFSMQVVSGEEYELEAFRRLQRTIFVPPRRGTIADRDGRPLAINEPGFDLMVVPEELTEESTAAVARLLDVPVEELAELYRGVEVSMEREVARELARHETEAGRPASAALEKKVRRHFRRQPWLLVPDLEDERRRLEIYVFPDRYPGFTIRPRAIRRYPEKDVACHVLGHMSRIYAEEYEDLRRAGYFMNDLVGRNGAEAIFEDRLRGIRGLEVVERDFKNNVRGRLIKDEAVAGSDVRLAIDLDLQRLAEGVLDQTLERERQQAVLVNKPPPRGAAAVVMDVETGDVYVMATTPRFDVNRVTKDYALLLADENGPLYDRTVAPPRVSAPGSVFKILTAIAGIESGVIEPRRTHNCRGFLHEPGKFRCHLRSGHGSLDLYRAIERSCDIYFYAEGEAMEDAHPDVMARWAEAFGLAGRTGIAVPREWKGIVPTRAWKREQIGEPWYPADSRFMAIGQGYVETTPMQVARFMAAVATGRLVRPRLDLARPVESERIDVSDAALHAVHEGMRLVVEGGGGTARSFPAFKSLRASAKTGTAEAGRGQEDHAWIAGFAPRERPRVAFVVLLENSGHGGEVAGPVAARILEAVHERLGW